jgi:hypothetical protein
VALEKVRGLAAITTLVGEDTRKAQGIKRQTSAKGQQILRNKVLPILIFY